ncbi:hypothetical protein NDU88_005423 [Pleurodeles waltl]|uniref:Uncharacterized protein n=1 Tax=Pleurodeles waltl TaxID=8319 RepID=A0AAV7QI36_PLEWA|nr:hypothetical protein NDU88_005423 [Pleurodeles waltl]
MRCRSGHERQPRAQALQQTSTGMGWRRGLNPCGTPYRNRGACVSGHNCRSAAGHMTLRWGVRRHTDP